MEACDGPHRSQAGHRPSLAPPLHARRLFALFLPLAWTPPHRLSAARRFLDTLCVLVAS